MPPILSADPQAAYVAARQAIDAAIRRVLESGRYVLGPEVEAFEVEFATYLGAGGAVGVANGTDALELALRALGIGAGDRVATVANSVSATAAAIIATGADPVFVEIDPVTMLMAPAALDAVLAATPGIKAVVPVHLYGQPCDLRAIIAIAQRHGTFVVEDCAQAHGAAIGDRKVGTWGDLAAFSFYPTKNLPALGDGGAVVGRDPALLDRVRLLRQYGWRTRYVSDLPGRNSRLDEIQAAILRAQLPNLDAANAQRTRLASRYLELLGGRAVARIDGEHPDAPASHPAVAHPGGARPDSPAPRSTPVGHLASLVLPGVAPGGTHVWHQFVVRSPRRDQLKAHLAEAGIHCGVLYPVPLHRQTGLGGTAGLSSGASSSARATNHPIAENLPPPSLPHTERACAEVLSLPLHCGITAADVERVCAAVRALDRRP